MNRTLEVDVDTTPKDVCTSTTNSVSNFSFERNDELFRKYTSPFVVRSIPHKSLLWEGVLLVQHIFKQHGVVEDVVHVIFRDLMDASILVEQDRVIHEGDDDSNIFCAIHPFTMEQRLFVPKDGYYSLLRVIYTMINRPFFIFGQGGFDYSGIFNFPVFLKETNRECLHYDGWDKTLNLKHIALNMITQKMLSTMQTLLFVMHNDSTTLNLPSYIQHEMSQKEGEQSAAAAVNDIECFPTPPKALTINWSLKKDRSVKKKIGGVKVCQSCLGYQHFFFNENDVTLAVQFHFSEKQCMRRLHDVKYCDDDKENRNNHNYAVRMIKQFDNRIGSYDNFVRHFRIIETLQCVFPPVFKFEDTFSQHLFYSDGTPFVLGDTKGANGNQNQNHHLHQSSTSERYCKIRQRHNKL